MGLTASNVIVLNPNPTLWVSVFRGTPTRIEIERAIARYDEALAGTKRYRHLMDFSGLTHADQAAFERFATWGQAVRARAERMHQWQAIVVPAGMLGALVHGFHRSVGFAIETRFFDSLETAIARSFRGAERRALQAEVLPQLRSTDADDLLERLRGAIRQAAGLSLQAAARTLGVSTRSLQRELRARDTSFVRERNLARCERILSMLRNPGEKIETIARELGFRSRQYFAQFCERELGATPSVLRERVAKNRPNSARKRPAS